MRGNLDGGHRGFRIHHLSAVEFDRSTPMSYRTLKCTLVNGSYGNIIYLGTRLRQRKYTFYRSYNNNYYRCLYEVCNSEGLYQGIKVFFTSLLNRSIR